MKLRIISPDNLIYSGDNVHLVQLPGIDGSFEIMNNHAPLISVLRKGNIKVVNQGEEPMNFEIRGGVIEVLHNSVLILAE